MSFELNKDGFRRENAEMAAMKTIEIKPLRKQQDPFAFPVPPDPPPVITRQDVEESSKREKAEVLQSLESEFFTEKKKFNHKEVYDFINEEMTEPSNDAYFIAQRLNRFGWLNRAGNKWTGKQVQKWMDQIAKPPVKISTKAEVLAMVFALPLSDNLLDKIAHLVRKEYA